MFFNTGADVAPRESAGARTLGNAAGLRRALLVGTILGAGALLQPGVGLAQTVINITSPITGAAAGVEDNQYTSSDNLTITTSATIESTANAGIFATRGPGSITITTAPGAAVTGTNASGIDAETGGGAINIGGTNGLGGNVSGTVGIYAISTLGVSAGDITIKTASTSTVTGINNHGILTDSGAGATTITANGAVSGANMGINATSTTGAISITSAGTVTGRSSGIATEAVDGDTTIAIGAAVTGGEAGKDASFSEAGVFAKATGSGAVTITSTAAIKTLSDNATGIVAIARGGDINIGGSAGLSGKVSGPTGIYTDNTGAGAITIKTVSGGVVAGGDYMGVETHAVDGLTTINLGDEVTSGGIAVQAQATGTGAINITSTAKIASTSNFGIYAAADTGAVNIGGAAGLSGAVSGSSAGIRASTNGSGTIDTKTAAGGTLTSTSGEGVRTNSVNGNVTISIGAEVSAQWTGVMADASMGTGNITITSTARISSTDDIAIAAYSGGGQIDIGGASGLSGAVSGVSGIFASTTGTGTIAIKTAAGGTVAAGNGSGIETSSAAGNTTIDLGANVSSTGSGTAVYGATQSGGLTIKTASGVSVTGGSVGIYAQTSSGHLDIGGTAGLGGTVSGVNYGIYARSLGDAGTIAIKTASGANVTGTAVASGIGILTQAIVGTTTITVGSGSTVTGGAVAIRTQAYSGAVVIDNSGTIRGSVVADKLSKYSDPLGDNVYLVQAGMGYSLVSAGTASFTLNNSGTFALATGQVNTGFTVNNLSGGVLTGTGNFGAVTAASGSTIRVGDRTLATPAMGVMTMSSLTLAAGGIVEVRADATNGSDRLNVTGAATITGATLSVLATPQTNAAWSDKKSFTVLSAGTLTGTFATVTTDYAYLKAAAALSSDGKSVIASLERNWTSFGAYSTTSNQKSVSDVFDKFQTSTANPLIAKVTTLTVAQAPVAMAQLSGTGLAAARTQSFSASGMFNGAVNAEMGKFTGSAGGGAVLSYAPEKKVTKAFDKVVAKPAEPILDGRFWMQVLGGVANMKSDATNPSERSTNFGLAAGADTALTPNIRAGLALSGGQSTSKVASLATKADAVWGQAALYGVATDGARYAKAALVYGYLSTETERTVTAFSTPETAKGKFGANLFSTRLEVGQKFLTGGPVNVTPFFAFEPSWLVQNGYSETGAATVALGYGKTTTHALPATLGMKFDADVALDGMRVTPSATVGWVHNFADTASLSPFFVALPGSTFTVAGAKGDRDLARTELNLEATPTGSTATFYANARADLGARTNAVRGTAGAMLRF